MTLTIWTTKNSHLQQLGYLQGKAFSAVAANSASNTDTNLSMLHCQTVQKNLWVILDVTEIALENHMNAYYSSYSQYYPFSSNFLNFIFKMLMFLLVLIGQFLPLIIWDLSVRKASYAVQGYCDFCARLLWFRAHFISQYWKSLGVNSKLSVQLPRLLKKMMQVRVLRQAEKRNYPITPGKSGSA